MNIQYTDFIPATALDMICTIEGIGHLYVDRCCAQLYRITFTKSSWLSSCVIEVTSVCLQFLLSLLFALTGVCFRNLLKVFGIVNFNALKLLKLCLRRPLWSLSGVNSKCQILSQSLSDKRSTFCHVMKVRVSLGMSTICLELSYVLPQLIMW